MQVRCMKAIVKAQPGAELNPRPEVGDVDTVTDEFMRNNRLYYSLERFGDNNGYLASCFATLPTEDQEKEIECEKEALIYQR
jgi:hypothetical protein